MSHHVPRHRPAVDYASIHGAVSWYARVCGSRVGEHHIFPYDPCWDTLSLTPLVLAVFATGALNVKAWVIDTASR